MVQLQPNMSEALDLAPRARISDDGTALRESEHKCRLNRAACLLKLQEDGAARRECEAALAEDGQHAKAHFRLGAALEALGAARRGAEGVHAGGEARREAARAARGARGAARADGGEPAARGAARRPGDGRGARAAHVQPGRPGARARADGARAEGRARREGRLGAPLGGAPSSPSRSCARRRARPTPLSSTSRPRAASTAPPPTAAQSSTRSRRRRRCCSTAAAPPTRSRRSRRRCSSPRSSANLASPRASSATSPPPTSFSTGRRRRRPPRDRVRVAGARALARRQDRYAEAIDLLNLGRHFRLAGNVDAAKEYLSDGVRLAEGLGYAHLLSVAFGQFGLLQIEHGKAHDRRPASPSTS